MMVKWNSNLMKFSNQTSLSNRCKSLDSCLPKHLPTILLSVEVAAVVEQPAVLMALILLEEDMATAFRSANPKLLSEPRLLVMVVNRTAVIFLGCLRKIIMKN